MNYLNYKDTYTFHCYTECGESFDIFELIKRIKSLNKLGDCGEDFYTIVLEVANFVNYNIHQQYIGEYVSEIDVYEENDTRIQLKEYDNSILDRFNYDLKITPWLDEGISQEVIKHNRIGYYLGKDQITIPHFDINGRFVGLRGRSISELDCDLYGKYRPMYINKQMYNHPLGMNLYNLNNSKD